MAPGTQVISGANRQRPSRRRCRCKALPPPPPAESSQQAEVRQLLEQARREIDAGNHEAAARLFESVLRLDPSNAIARDALERWRSGARRPPPH